MRPIPVEVKRQILGLWLNATTVRQISTETKVSTGEISNIINAYRQGIPDLEQLRKLHLNLKEANVGVPDALRGASFMRSLDELGFDGGYLPGCLEFIRKAGERAPELTYAAGRLIELETQSGKPYDKLLLDFSGKFKAQAELSARIKSLEGREVELNHSIRHLEQLQRLQETLDRHSIAPDVLDILIRDGLRLRELRFTAQQAETLARELKQTGLDPATACARIARLLKECSDLESAREKTEVEANKWQTELDKVKRETTSLQEECTRVKDQLGKLEQAHEERKELLERQHQALASTRRQELEATLLTRKLKIETELQDLQNRAGQLRIEVEKLESAKANMSDAEAELQRIEQSVKRSRTFATVALLVETPSSLKASGNVLEVVLAILEGFKIHVQTTDLTSWRNRPNLEEAAERLSRRLAEEATR